VFERGDLVLISFPFSDLSAAKKRPVLMLTRPDAYGDFIALAVTSRPQTDHGIAIPDVRICWTRDTVTRAYFTAPAGWPGYAGSDAAPRNAGSFEM
jgi:hypothetical protein